jgi:hypothetical protein
MQNRSSIVGRQKLGPRLWPDQKETLAKVREFSQNCKRYPLFIDPL